MTGKIRKYHHNQWTISGITRSKTIQTLLEKNSEHGYECGECGKLYEKYKSLEIHKSRIHKEGYFLCPLNCGSRLLSKHAVKKHLLTHTPKETWPYKCPICGQMFQAKGDIPKHLKTKYHQFDNIPTLGSKSLFRLRFVYLRRSNGTGLQR